MYHIFALNVDLKVHERDTMGNVAITFKILPKSSDVDINLLVNKIRELNPNDIKTENLAFGIKIIKALFIIPDNKGSSEIEEKLRNIEEIGEVETESLTLI